jgi:hypothetical protein
VPPPNIRIHMHTHARPPAVGDIVTFTSETNLRHDMPANPVVTRIRTDLTWDDVLHSHYTDHTSGVSLKGSARPLGFWTPGNMRAHLENFIRSKNLDPLLPESWYHSVTDIRTSKSGRVIISKFNGYAHAIQSLFPELSFCKNSFKRVFWGKIENRRKFFEQYAKQNGFDPLIPTNWYVQFKHNILATKVILEFTYARALHYFTRYLTLFQGAQRAISYHRHSISRALLDLFPNIGLERKKLLTRPSALWKSIANHKLFFENYAKEHAFDPLHPLGWYKQTKSRIMSFQDASKVLSLYNNNIAKALQRVFPNISLDKHKLFTHNYWDSTEARRSFFIQYAQRHAFDPLQPHNWYRQQHIVAQRGARRVLAFHRNSVPRALLDLFPEIGLDAAKLRRTT